MNNKKQKELFYSNKNNVTVYNEQRFSNKGGNYVNQKEINIIKNLIIKNKITGNVLDIPVGTGRISKHLVKLDSIELHAADYSEEMLQATKIMLKTNIRISREDIYNMKYEDSKFDLLVCSRFLFHSDNQEDLLKEIKRVVKPGGYIIFDTLNWSPRSYLGKFNDKFGGKIFTNNKKSIYKLTNKLSLKVIESEKIFALPSYFYKFIPNNFFDKAIKLERYYPKIFMSKTFWLLKNEE